MGTLPETARHRTAKERIVNDEELIEKTLAGDKEAFGLLALKYKDRVYNLALPIVGNKEDALDVVQDTFMQALAHLENFRRSSRFYTWLYRIAYNTAVGALRKRKRKPRASLEYLNEEYGDCFEAQGDAPDDDAKRRDDAAILRRELAKLSEEYRTPLILREVEGANYEQIAEILNVPVGTVRSRLHRARIALRERLERAGLKM